MASPRQDPNLERLAAISQLYGALVEPQQHEEDQKQRRMMEMLSLALTAHQAQQHQQSEDKHYGQEADWHHQAIDAQQQERAASTAERADVAKARLLEGQHGTIQSFLGMDPQHRHEAAVAAPHEFGEMDHNLSQADIPALQAAVRQLYATSDMKESSRAQGLTQAVAQHPGAADLLDWTDESLYGKKTGAVEQPPMAGFGPPADSSSLANTLGQKGHEMAQRIGTGMYDGAAVTANYTAVPIWNALRGLFGKSAVSPIQYK